MLKLRNENRVPIIVLLRASGVFESLPSPNLLLLLSPQFTFFALIVYIPKNSNHEIDIYLRIL